MITRRSLIFAAATALAGAMSNHALAAPPAADDPAVIINAIYARVTKGKGDEGGGFVVLTKAARIKYLSKPLVELWVKTDALTPKGDVGPIDFDPVTNSQDPDVKSVKVTTEKAGTDKVTLAVALTSHGDPRKNAADDVIRYDFVREAAGWKIDDIRGAVDGTPWSVRELHMNYLKLLQGKKSGKK